ncbi:MAG TPA: YggT family protein [Thermomicrobiales bacterium]|nr:YggT family protein [Thermomicrobiales bacterium]
MGITELLLNILRIYTFILVARALFSWFDPGYRTTIGRILYDVTEPVVGPVRQVVPSTGGLDFSIMITVFLVFILQRILISAL